MGRYTDQPALAHKGSFPALDYHWKRLASSAPLLGIPLPFTYEELKSMLDDLLEQNNLKDKLAGARGILPTQTLPPNFLISVFECATSHDKPFSACVVNTRKNEHTIASRVKTISYIDNILAKQEAMAQGFDEAILLNTASNVADGSIANIFMVKDQQVFTPLVSDGALPGVVRAILLEEFSKDFPIIEKTINLMDLKQADEVFLTNALMGVKSVQKLNDQRFSSFTVANQLSALLRERKNYI